ncbi:MAG: hypothetical protein LBD91_03175 [Prevotellaceae bacterium]|jgi:hypothetical protein|nr:hypothetical protein [Prevotellaceae bacterium]
MTTTRSTLKSWFVRGAKPLASQFAAWIDSYWHKDDADIPAGNVQADATDWSILSGDDVQAALNSADTLLDTIRLGSPQGVKTYYGTQEQVEAVESPTVGQTAIAFNPDDNTPQALAGYYSIMGWEWLPVEPAPANGMWAAIEQILADNSSGIIFWIDDGEHPPRFDAFKLFEMGVADAVLNRYDDTACKIWTGTEEELPEEADRSDDTLYFVV